MIRLYKYHGTGNDFVLIDNRSGDFDQHNFELVKDICHRRFGIGADGVILIEDSDQYDFSMDICRAPACASTGHQALYG